MGYKQQLTEEKKKEYHLFFDSWTPQFIKLGDCLRICILENVIYVVDFSLSVSVYQLFILDGLKSNNHNLCKERLDINTSHKLLFLLDNLNTVNQIALRNYLNKLTQPKTK